MTCAHNLNYCLSQVSLICNKCIDGYKYEDISNSTPYCTPYPIRVQIAEYVTLVCMFLLFIYVLIKAIRKFWKGYLEKRRKTLKNKPKVITLKDVPKTEIPKKGLFKSSNKKNPSRTNFKQTEQTELNIEFNHKHMKKGYTFFN
jgi:hypothetical protein